MDKIYVYIHTSPSGKSYVGQTSKSLVKRWGKNGNGYKNQKKFYNAIKNYGWDNFSHSILCVCNSREEADAAEINFIKKFNSIINGYNVDKGGHSLDEEARKKISEASRPTRKVYCIDTGIVYESVKDASIKTKTYKTTIVKCCKNKLGKTNGLHWAYYEDYLNNNIKEYSPRYKKKAVRCVETGEIFDSCISAASKYGTRAIESCARGEISTSCGFHWEFVDTKYRVNPKEPKSNPLKKNIICLDDLKIFNSIKSAANFYGVPSSKICLCCKGINSSTKGLRFAYLEDYNCGNLPQFVNKTIIKPVICIETGVYYPSLAQAGKNYGTSSRRIGEVCSGKKASYNGTHWRYATEEEQRRLNGGNENV